MPALLDELMAMMRDLPREQICALAAAMEFFSSNGTSPLHESSLSATTTEILSRWRSHSDELEARLLHHEARLRGGSSGPKLEIPRTKLRTADWDAAMLVHSGDTLSQPDQMLLAISILKREQPKSFITVTSVGQVWLDKLKSKPGNLSDILTKMTLKKSGESLLRSAGKKQGSPKTYEFTEAGERELLRLERFFTGITTSPASPTASG